MFVVKDTTLQHSGIENRDHDRNQYSRIVLWFLVRLFVGRHRLVVTRASRYQLVATFDSAMKDTFPKSTVTAAIDTVKSQALQYEEIIHIDRHG